MRRDRAAGRRLPSSAGVTALLALAVLQSLGSLHLEALPDMAED